MPTFKCRICVQTYLSKPDLLVHYKVHQQREKEWQSQQDTISHIKLQCSLQIHNLNQYHAEREEQQKHVHEQQALEQRKLFYKEKSELEDKYISKVHVLESQLERFTQEHEQRVAELEHQINQEKHAYVQSMKQLQETMTQQEKDFSMLDNLYKKRKEEIEHKMSAYEQKQNEYDALKKINNQIYHELTRLQKQLHTTQENDTLKFIQDFETKCQGLQKQLSAVQLEKDEITSQFHRLLENHEETLSKFQLLEISAKERDRQLTRENEEQRNESIKQYNMLYALFKKKRDVFDLYKSLLASYKQSQQALKDACEEKRNLQTQLTEYEKKQKQWLKDEIEYRQKVQNIDQRIHVENNKYEELEEKYEHLKSKHSEFIEEYKKQTQLFNETKCQNIQISTAAKKRYRRLCMAIEHKLYNEQQAMITYQQTIEEQKTFIEKHTLKEQQCKDTHIEKQEYQLLQNTYNILNDNFLYTKATVKEYEEKTNALLITKEKLENALTAMKIQHETELTNVHQKLHELQQTFYEMQSSKRKQQEEWLLYKQEQEHELSRLKEVAEKERSHIDNMNILTNKMENEICYLKANEHQLKLLFSANLDHLENKFQNMSSLYKQSITYYKSKCEALYQRLLSTIDALSQKTHKVLALQHTDNLASREAYYEEVTALLHTQYELSHYKQRFYNINERHTGLIQTLEQERHKHYEVSQHLKTQQETWDRTTTELQNLQNKRDSEYSQTIQILQNTKQTLIEEHHKEIQRYHLLQQQYKIQIQQLTEMQYHSEQKEKQVSLILDNERKHWNDTNSAYQQNLQHLQETMMKKQTCIEELQKTLADVRTEYHEQTKTLRKVQKDLDDLQTQYVQSTTRSKRLESDIQNFQDQMYQFDNDRQTIENTCRQLTTEKRLWEEKYLSLYNKHQEYFDNEVKLRTYDVLLAEADDLRNKNHDLKCEHSTLRTQLHTLTERYTEMQNKYQVVLDKLQKQHSKFKSMFKKRE